MAGTEVCRLFTGAA